jgi:hypothetical protein
MVINWLWMLRKSVVNVSSGTVCGFVLRWWLCIMCSLVLVSQVTANLVLFLGKAVRARFYISSCFSRIIFSPVWILGIEFILIIII